MERSGGTASISHIMQRRRDAKQMIMMAATTTSSITATLDDLEEDALFETLSHFNLTELAEIRKVSPQLAKACDSRKEYIHSLLKNGASIEIVGLASERGKQLNNRLGTVYGPINNGRYPVKIQHLTGEVEKVSLKPQNINPFLKDQQKAKEQSKLDFINYSSDARVREGHGRLFDQVLMLLRYAVNVMNGFSYFSGEFEDFMNLSRSSQAVSGANTQVFSMYRVTPSTAGYKVPGDMSILDSTIHSMAESESMAIDMLGKMANYEKRDGKDGRLIVRNMVRAMQTWDKERIHGEFWIARIAKYGTLVVQKENHHNVFARHSELGNVYLVKGIGDQVGGQVPKSALPILVRTTFLPLYNFLVYDGIMLGDATEPMTPALKEMIKRHVDKAVREQTVIYCGESASKGLWDEVPPEIVKPVPSDDYGQKSNASSFGAAPKKDIKEEGEPYKPKPDQLKAAIKIIKLAKSRKFKSGKGPGMPLLVIRKMGYTKEDNPMQICGLMYHNNADNPIEPFQFKKWPSYTLDELLPEIFKRLKYVHVFPGLFWVDDQSVVEPLRQVLKAANEAAGFHEEIDVEWYPPPSEEEQAYHGQYGF